MAAKEHRERKERFLTSREKIQKTQKILRSLRSFAAIRIETS
jgi:hypothetical protein